VRTEIFDPLMPLVHDSPIKNLKVWVGNELAYDGVASVRGVVDTGVSQVCEFALNGGWLKRRRKTMPEGTDGIEGEARAFVERAAGSRTVRPAFRLAVADAATFLSEMRAWCDAAELKWNRQLTDPDALQRLLRLISPAMQSVFDGLEKEAAQVGDDAMGAHVDLARSSLHPLLLCSPFIHRCYTKPLGYPGDFGLMNRMLDQPFEGDSLFARMVNGWLVNSAAGEAYRCRVGHLENVLAREAFRLASGGRVLRTLSLGCGAAPETVRFVRHHEASEGASFTLLDFNAETVSHANHEIAAAAAAAGRNIRLNVQQYSVRQMLTAGERLLANRRLLRSGPVERGAFDVLYCAGLFDYLSDRVCARLLDVFWELAAPGALIVATNFTPANPIRRFMDYLLDWRLNYRDEGEILRLVPSLCPEGGFKVSSPAGSVEVILELRKPATSNLPVRRIQPTSVAAI
jgi:extracellular factor (EF) 3-hydroxypalmitic acid methyl ester biosynthesis protein